MNELPELECALVVEPGVRRDETYRARRPEQPDALFPKKGIDIELVVGNRVALDEEIVLGDQFLPSTRAHPNTADFR